MLHQHASYQSNTTHEITQQISHRLLRMDVLTSETCWTLNNEIIKQVIKLVSLYSSTLSAGDVHLDQKGLITYLLTPWSRVLLKKLTGVQLVKRFPTFYGTWRFITTYTGARHQVDPVPTPTSHFQKIHLNIILSSMPESPKWSLSLRSPQQSPVYASPLPHTHYMPRPSRSSQFYHPKNIGWAVQIIKLLIM